MKIVADACTIILLAKAGVLETVAKTYTLIITEQVLEEVLAGKKHGAVDAVITEKLYQNKFIQTKRLKSPIIMRKLMKDFGMGKGEAATVAYALSEPVGAVATDNRQGRKAAQINQIPLVGSIEIIVTLKMMNKLSLENAQEALKLLQRNGWFDINLIEKAMEDVKND